MYNTLGGPGLHVGLLGHTVLQILPNKLRTLLFKRRNADMFLNIMAQIFTSKKILRAALLADGLYKEVAVNFPVIRQ